MKKCQVWNCIVDFHFVFFAGFSVFFLAFKIAIKILTPLKILTQGTKRKIPQENTKRKSTIQFHT